MKTQIQDLSTAYARWILARPWRVLAFSLLVTFAAIAGASRLAFTSDYAAFFSKENPQLLAFQRMQETYTKGDNILMVVKPRSGDIFSPSVLSTLAELTEAAWKIPHAISVDSLTNFQHLSAAGDELVIDPLVSDPAGLDEQDIARLKAVAASEPSLSGRLISRDLETAAILTTLQLPENDPQAVAAAVSHAEQLVANVEERFPELELAITGLTPIANSYPRAAQADLSSLVPLMYLIIVGVLAVMLRSLTGVLASIAVLILSVMAAMGMGGWLGIELTPPTGSVPTIVTTIAIAESVHVLVTALKKMQAGVPKLEALEASICLNFQPMLLATVTTIIGFSSLNFAESPPFRDLGNMVAMGAAFAWFLAISFVPCLLRVAPIKSGKVTTLKTPFVDWLVGLVTRRRRLILASTLSVAGLLAAALPLNRIDDRIVETFSERMQIRRDTQFALDHLTGVYQVEFSLESGKDLGISEVAYLVKLEAFADWLRQQPEVAHVTSFSDTMKRLNRAMHGGADSHYRLPESQELAAQYLLLYELSLPYGTDLNGLLNVDKSATRVISALGGLTTSQIQEFKHRADAWLHSHGFPDAEGTGLAAMFSFLSHRNITDMLWGEVSSIVLITICMLFWLRSMKLTLLSLVPNLLPVVVAFGAWGLLHGRVDSAASMVPALTLGLIVDDTMHLMTKYVHARRHLDMTAEQAIRSVYSTTGTAVITTGIVLMAGFGTLAFSNFKLNSNMGLLAVLVIGVAVILDLLLLPALLLWLDRGEVRQVAAAAEMAPQPTPEGVL